jgi:hypothetical protein
MFVRRTLTLAAVALVAACTHDSPTDPFAAEGGILNSESEPGFCAEADEFTLWAGQDIEAGTVTLSADGDILYVKFQTAGDWLLKETHVHVGTSIDDIPTAGNGQGGGQGNGQGQGNSGGDKAPVPGQFEYSTEHNPLRDSFTYEIALEEDWEFETLVVATHAVVVKIDGDGYEVDSETAWGGNEEGPGNRWWYFAEFELKECNGDEDPNGTPLAGCSQGYWGNAPHADWGSTGYDKEDDYRETFGITDGFNGDLLEAVNATGGADAALARQAVAALLSAAHPDVDFGLTEAEVIAIVQAAYAPGGDVEEAKDELEGHIQAGDCPLGNDDD